MARQALKEKATPLQMSAVRRVASALRRDVIDRAEGELLGSEDDLIARYGVSRPTLRQATALVCQEHLLTVKRGVGGGYFASRPSTKAVAHVAAVYLRSRNTQVSEVIDAVAPIRVELAKLAANCGDQAALARLDSFVEKEKDQGPDQRYIDFLKSEREFGHILGEMGQNNVIALFLEILYDFSSMLTADEDVYVHNPERVRDYRTKRNRLAEALLEQDEDLAVVAARRCSLSSTVFMPVSESDRSSAFLDMTQHGKT